MASFGKFAVAALALSLSGCSHIYAVTASMRDGKVVFSVESAAPQSPVCLRKIDVVAMGERQPVWEENISYEDPCKNRFPITYGERFRGRRMLEDGTIAAKPLLPGVTYEVRTTTGANGYGSGHFAVLDDGTVKNLP